MRAGDLDRELVVRKRVAGPRDAGGHPTPTWEDQDPIYTERTDVRDGERMHAEGVGASLSVRFLVRVEDAAGLTTQDRVRCDGELFDVVGIKQADGRAGIEITAAAAVDG